MFCKASLVIKNVFIKLKNKGEHKLSQIKFKKNLIF